MNKERWIGIQFNFDEKQDLKKWILSYKDLNLETDGEHITIKLSIQDLNKSTLEIRESKIIEFIFTVINKFARKSSYTTCYGHIENSKLDKRLPKIKRKFKDRNEIEVEPLKDTKTLIEDFSLLMEDFEMSKIIKDNEIYKYLNCIRERFLLDKLDLNRLKMMTSVEYMDKEEWGDEMNLLRMDIKFEERENAA